MVACRPDVLPDTIVVVSLRTRLPVKVLLPSLRIAPNTPGVAPESTVVSHQPALFSMVTWLARVRPALTYSWPPAWMSMLPAPKLAALLPVMRAALVASVPVKPALLPVRPYLLMPICDALFCPWNRRVPAPLTLFATVTPALLLLSFHSSVAPAATLTAEAA